MVESREFHIAHLQPFPNIKINNMAHKLSVKTWKVKRIAPKKYLKYSRHYKFFIHDIWAL
jgi:hypothetical protein